jgi:translocation protein SEC63
VDRSPRIDCSCEACEKKRQLLVSRQRKQLYEPHVIRKYVLLVIGWGIVGFMAYRIATTKIENEIWDPYAILGISTSSSLDVIKSHYKNLTRTIHPDKIKLVGNMTKEIVEQKFVNITKAYKAYSPSFETVDNGTG